MTLRNGDAMVDTATVPAEGDLSVTFGDLATGTTYTASAVATNVADDSAPGTVSAAPFVPADTTALTIGGRACPAGSSITWKVVNSLDIPVDFNWFARTAQSAGAGVVEAGASTEITTAFVGPTRNVFQVQVDRVLQVRARSLLTRNCPVVAT